MLFLPATSHFHTSAVHARHRHNPGPFRSSSVALLRSLVSKAGFPSNACPVTIHCYILSTRPSIHARIDSCTKPLVPSRNETPSTGKRKGTGTSTNTSSTDAVANSCRTGYTPPPTTLHLASWSARAFTQHRRAWNILRYWTKTPTEHTRLARTRG